MAEHTSGKATGKVKRRRLVRDYPRRQRLVGVPPADSPIWPEQYRGQRWKPVYGIMLQGKCLLCAYSFPLPKSRQMLDEFHKESPRVLCTNHPSAPGELTEMFLMGTCRNFKAKRWHNFGPKRSKAPAAPVSEGCDPSVRRIPLGNGFFATVDAADYEMLSKHKWMARHIGRTRIYAYCRVRGRLVSMHRMIMRPRKSKVVDHIDGNGLNNCRRNLRICRQDQNRANSGPRSRSGFVGVYPSRGKWAAGIWHKGKYHYLGRFDDPVEAAKARDRKAYELHGPYAYLNRPQDFRRNTGIVDV